MAATNVEKLLLILISQFQDLENALIQLLNYRSIDTATGVQLDTIGKIVGQERNGLDDETYRRYCRARIAANRSSGTTNELIKVIGLIVYDDTAVITLTQEGTATARLLIDDLPITDALAAIVFNFVNAARAAGVRIVVEWTSSPFVDTFTLNLGPGFNIGHFAGSLG